MLSENPYRKYVPTTTALARYVTRWMGGSGHGFYLGQEKTTSFRDCFVPTYQDIKDYYNSQRTELLKHGDII